MHLFQPAAKPVGDPNGASTVVLTVDDWMAFLRNAGALMAIPLTVGGLGVMLLGWRISRYCVAVALAAIGFFAVGARPGLGENAIVFMAAAAIVVAGLSYLRPKEAAPLVGGAVGAIVLILAVKGFGLHGPTLWPVGAAGFLGGTAWAAINRRMLTVVATSFEGAVLFVSGLAVLLMAIPSTAAQLTAMTADGTFVAAFALFVATAAASFFQMADVRRAESGT